MVSSTSTPRTPVNRRRHTRVSPPRAPLRRRVRRAARPGTPPAVRRLVLDDALLRQIWSMAPSTPSLTVKPRSTFRASTAASKVGGSSSTRSNASTQSTARSAYRSTATSKPRNNTMRRLKF